LTENWRNSYTVDLRDMHSSPNNSGDLMEKNEMGGKCGIYVERRSVYSRGRQPFSSVVPK